MWKPLFSFTNINNGNFSFSPIVIENLKVNEKPNLIPHERAIYSRKNVGSDYIGWLHFQPVIDKLITQEKDMFD